jgi:Transposase and inactivated derivatives
MSHKYIVDLIADEQECLLNLIKKGKPTARRVSRAHVLLLADEGATDEEIAESLHLGLSTVHRTRQRFVEEGLTAALSEQPRAGRTQSLSGKQEAFIVALACSTPPEGRCRWTMQLLAERLIELKQVEEVSHDTVRRVLKKTISNRGCTKSGVFPA